MIEVNDKKSKVQISETEYNPILNESYVLSFYS